MNLAPLFPWPSKLVALPEFAKVNHNPPHVTHNFLKLSRNHFIGWPQVRGLSAKRNHLFLTALWTLVHKCYKPVNYEWHEIFFSSLAPATGQQGNLEEGKGEKPLNVNASFSSPHCVGEMWPLQIPPFPTICRIASSASALLNEYMLSNIFIPPSPKMGLLTRRPEAHHGCRSPGWGEISRSLPRWVGLLLTPGHLDFCNFPIPPIESLIRVF